MFTHVSSLLSTTVHMYVNKWFYSCCHIVFFLHTSTRTLTRLCFHSHTSIRTLNRFSTVIYALCSKHMMMHCVQQVLERFMSACVPLEWCRNIKIGWHEISTCFLPCRGSLYRRFTGVTCTVTSQVAMACTLPEISQLPETPPNGKLLQWRHMSLMSVHDGYRTCQEIEILLAKSEQCKLPSFCSNLFVSCIAEK